MPEVRVDFVRLTEVPLAAVAALLDEPRNRRHLPLAGDPMDADQVAQWVAAKDGQWESNGYGPWAVLVDGDFAGWGGFQQEEHGPDFALVLAPAHWGRGARVTRAALDIGFDELGLDVVTIALPYTRSPDRVVARYGWTACGETTYGGVRFRQYRLTAAAWAARRTP
jgi:[ribosomal protein S5]-alanine N-acetyltransferase